jgi:hypothetical protein
MWACVRQRRTRPACAAGRKDRDERRAVRSELRQLAREERQRQERAVEEVLRGAQVGWLRAPQAGPTNLGPGHGCSLDAPGLAPCRLPSLLPALPASHSSRHSRRCARLRYLAALKTATFTGPSPAPPPWVRWCAQR